MYCSFHFNTVALQSSALALSAVGFHFVVIHIVLWSCCSLHLSKASLLISFSVRTVSGLTTCISIHFRVMWISKTCVEGMDEKEWYPRHRQVSFQHYLILHESVTSEIWSTCIEWNPSFSSIPSYTVVRLINPNSTTPFGN